MNDLIIRQQEITTNTGDDDHLIELWLRKQATDHTRESYGRTVAEFRNFVNRNIRQIALDDLLSFAESQRSQSVATQARKIATIKSLLTFAHTTGYTPFNVGRAVRPPQAK